MSIALARQSRLERTILHGFLSRESCSRDACRSSGREYERGGKTRWTGVQCFSSSSGRSAWKNHYEVLGVSRSASKAKIKERYHALAKLFHPDTGIANGDASKFRAVIEARDVLLDPKKRSEHDRQLAAAAPRPMPRSSSRPAQAPAHASAEPTSPPGPSASHSPKSNETASKAGREAKATQDELDRIARARAEADAKRSEARARAQQTAQQAQKGKTRPTPDPLFKMFRRTSRPEATPRVQMDTDRFKRISKGLVKNPWAELAPPSHLARRPGGRLSTPLPGVQSANPYEQPDDTSDMVFLMQARYKATGGGTREPPGTKGDPNELGVLMRLHFALKDEHDDYIYEVPVPEEEDDRALAEWGIDHLENVRKTLMWQGVLGTEISCVLHGNMDHAVRRGDPSRPTSRNYYFVPLRIAKHLRGSA